jgi:anti-sigma factor RsiW
MRCDEFEAIGLDDGRDASLTDTQRDSAAAHAASCSRCAALRDSWVAARLELCSLALATAAAEAPARVEMHLRQQFRAQDRTPKVRRRAVVATWALAAAAALIGAVSWVNWRSNQRHNVAVMNNPSNASPVTSNSSANSGAGPSNQRPTDENSGATAETLVAGNELSDFTLLPGVLPADTDGAAILRVRMQRGALGALGLPVNEDRAGDWIQVDLLVGNDGLPQAVRLPE